MLRRLELFLALAVLPGTAGLLFHLRGAGGISVVLAAYAVALAGVVAFAFRWPREYRALAGAAADRERALAAQRGELQARVDFLSAEREISLILNEDVDFRAIFERVLTITADTLGGDVELWMPEGGRLALRAARRSGKTEFDLEAREDRRVRQCFEAGRIVLESEEGRFHALAPLQKDREIVGVARITIAVDGSAGTREERMRVLNAHFEEFSKFLALALKTPDLYTRAVQDGLTGLWTKRHFLSQAPLALEAARRYGEPLSLILVDIDHFKKVNDTHGHPVGDKVLKGVAEVLRKKVRGASVFRYGGEEMAVLLPKTDAARAAEVAERLRKGVEAHKISGVKVTASFGVAELGAGMADAAALVEQADQALYRAKQGGRNRVVAAPGASDGSEPTRRWQRSA